MFVVFGMCYGIEEVIEFLEKVYKVVVLGVYCLLVDMVKECGVFDVYDLEREKNNLFINCLCEVDLVLYEDMKKYGCCNIVCLIIVFIGIISLMI